MQIASSKSLTAKTRTAISARFGNPGTGLRRESQCRMPATDLILGVDGAPMASIDGSDLADRLTARGNLINLRVFRGGSALDVTIDLR